MVSELRPVKMARKASEVSLDALEADHTTLKEAQRRILEEFQKMKEEMASSREEQVQSRNKNSVMFQQFLNTMTKQLLGLQSSFGNCGKQSEKGKAVIRPPKRAPE